MEVGSKLIELIAQAPQIVERADPEQRRQLVGLLPSNRVLKERTLEFELRKPFDALVSAANSENGWGERIRTFDYLIQSQAPYRLATPQRGCHSLSKDFRVLSFASTRSTKVTIRDFDRLRVGHGSIVP